jgi:hypothetical protein
MSTSQTHKALITSILNGVVSFTPRTLLPPGEEFPVFFEWEALRAQEKEWRFRVRILELNTGKIG